MAYKNEFFGIVSHELRTPLTSILAYARILNADDSLAPNLTREAGERNRVERHAFAEHGEQHPRCHFPSTLLKRTSFCPNRWISSIWPSSCARRLAPIAEGKDVRLSCSVAPDVPLSMADWEKLRRILENLVNDAIKYTHRGGFVRLTIGFESGEEANHGHGNHPGTHIPQIAWSAACS